MSPSGLLVNRCPANTAHPRSQRTLQGECDDRVLWEANAVAARGRGVAHVAAGNHWILAESRRLRLSTLFILYVAQGVPIGLFWFAIPAWMAANGASAADVGYVLGLTALPWTLKLVNGFIMDRYTFLAMGRRRIWIIGAQMVMIAMLVGAR